MASRRFRLTPWTYVSTTRRNPWYSKRRSRCFRIESQISMRMPTDTPSVPRSVAVFKQSLPEAIYEIEPSKLEDPFFRVWDERLRAMEAVNTRKPAGASLPGARGRTHPLRHHHL